MTFQRLLALTTAGTALVGVTLILGARCLYDYVEYQWWSNIASGMGSNLLTFVPLFFLFDIFVAHSKHENDLAARRKAAYLQRRLAQLRRLQAPSERQEVIRDLIRRGLLSGTRVNLQGACLRNNDFSGVDLSGADCRNADFTNAILVGTRFDGAQLSEATFDGACLSNSSLNNASIRSGKFRGAQLHAADMRAAFIGGSDFRGASLAMAQLSGARVTGTNVPEPTCDDTTTMPNHERWSSATTWRTFTG